MPEEKVKERIEALLESQLLAVLSTQRHGQPYSSLMAYAHTPDLATLVFATPKPTRKYANLLAEPRVSLLVDSRSNEEVDFHAASAVTVIGKVEEVNEESMAKLKSLFLKKHPYLHDFVNSPSTALLRVAVKHYILVDRFQQIMELHLTDEMDIFS